MNIVAIILSNTIAFGIPLLLVALGGMFSERSGIINIALEGIMIIGALAGCLVLKFFNLGSWGPAHAQLSVLISIVVAAVAGGLFSLLLAFASIHLKADQTIGGTALNTFAPAFAVVLTWAIQGTGQTTINIPTWTAITPRTLGFSFSTNTNFFTTLMFKSFYLTTPICIIILIGATIFLSKTRLGLRLRACGEHPQAADSVGIDVYKIRYLGVTISGVLAGIGGMAYVFAVGTGFQSEVMGYGFLALAVMIFGNWKPLRIGVAAVFFALFKGTAAMSGSISFLPTFSHLKNSQNIYLILPYLVTMIVLAFTSKKSRAPKAEGIPYDKGAR